MSHSASDLGARLRAIRSEHGWRISDVSRMTGLAASTISKVETGQMSLTYDKMLQLVQGLNLDFSVLFSPASAGSRENLVTARRSIGRDADIAYVDVEGYASYGYLNTDIAHKKMTPLLGEAKAHSLEEFGRLIRHPGEEFIYVLDGLLEVHTEFYNPVILKPGEHLYIDSNMGHAYISAGEGTSRFICVCSGNSEALQRDGRPEQKLKESGAKPGGRPKKRRASTSV